MTEPKRRAKMWDLGDLIGSADLAKAYGVGRPAISNWAKRFPDFPKSLTQVSGGPVYSRKQVAAWHKKHFGARAEKMRERADRLEQAVERLRERAARYDP